MTSSKLLVIAILIIPVVLLCGCCIYVCLKNLSKRRQNACLVPRTIIYSATLNETANQNPRDSVNELDRIHHVPTNNSSANNMTASPMRRQISAGNVNSVFYTEDFSPPPPYDNIEYLPSYQEVMNAQEDAHAHLTPTQFDSSARL